MTNPVFIIACDNMVGETMYTKFEDNPARMGARILSPFAVVSPLNAAHFINERNAKYAIDQTPSLRNPRIVKLTANLEEVA